MLPRAGFLRLVRPASNAVVRRTALGSARPAVCLSLNSSASIPMRSISSSPVLNQSAATATMTQTSQPINNTAEEASTVPENDVLTDTHEKDTTSHSRALEIMKEYQVRRSTGSPMNLGEYVEVLGKLSNVRAFEESMMVLKDLQEAGFKPTATVYGHVFRAGRRSLRMNEARELFGNPSPQSHKPAENEKAEGEQYRTPFFHQMKELKAAMEAEGIQFETWFYDDLAYWFSGNNWAGMLINVAIYMESHGIAPSTTFYNRMLYTLPRAGFSDRADILFSRMVLNGVCDMTSYVVRLGTLVANQRLAEADDLFSRMSQKYDLNVVAYNTLINGYLNARQFTRAVDLLEKMKNSETCKPNEVTATTFVTYFFETGQLDDARDILTYFKDTLGYPSTSTHIYNLMRFFGRYDPMQCCRLIQEQLSTNPNFDVNIYNSIIFTLADSRVPVGWKRNIGDTAIDKTYTVRPGSLAEICQSLPYHIRHLLARMDAYNVEPDSNTFDHLMRSLTFRRDYSAVKKLYSMLEKKSALMMSSHRNHYLAAMILSGTPKPEIEKYLLVMKYRRWPISAVNTRRLGEIGLAPPPGAYFYSKTVEETRSGLKQ